MNVLSLDLGNKLGVCSYKNKKYSYEYFELKGDASTIMTKFCALICNLTQKHKPDIVVTSSPILAPYRTNIFGSQMKKFGAVCFACALLEIPLVDYKDSHAKKVVLLHGGSKKADIKEYYAKKKGIPDIEDVRDARMFLDCYLIESSQSN